MKRLSNLPLLLLIATISVGCGSLRRCEPFGLSSIDSVKVEVERREVVVYDTVSVKLPQIEQRVRAHRDTSLLKNRYCLSEAIILPTGDLHHTLQTIAQEIKAPTKSRVEVKDSIIYRQREVTRIVERERELSAWQQFQITGFRLLLLLYIMMILLRRIL